MLPSKLAFVDIETTGCSLHHDRIIEVGVLRVENNKLVDTFKTLVNPETYLPDEITGLTGISSTELERAPNFSSIQKDLFNILEDCVFVAHNVRFDYGFIKSEFKREEINFKSKNLCTVKLSRNLFPKFKHHSLDSLIERFEFECESRHRAFEDAEVLWKFYQMLLEKFSSKKLETAWNTVSKRPSLPIKISEKMLDELPEGPGVYVFYGKDGMPLYVGKSVNIHDRVLSHFSGDTEDSKEMKIAQQVESIETFTTAGELGALFKEAQMVKQLQPLYNRQLRRARKMIIVKQCHSGEDQGDDSRISNDIHAMHKRDSGRASLARMTEYTTVSINEVDEINPSDLENILGIFKSKMQARNFLLEICQENQLCEKLLGLENGKGECFGFRLGKCRGACVGKESSILYNGRFSIAFSKNKLRQWPFAGAVSISEKNEVEEIVEQHVVDQWCYLGTIRTNGHTDSSGLSKEIKFDLDTYKILNRYFNHAKTKNINRFEATFDTILS